MIDPKKLFEDFLGGGANKSGGPAAGGKGSGWTDNLGTLATGALGGGVIGLLLGSKKVRKFGGSALGYGGAAVLGGLAFKAWQDWQAKRAPAPAQAPVQQPLALPPPSSPFDLETQSAAGGGDARIAVVRAMIAAAKADGHIDATEQRALFDRIGQLGLDTEQKAFVMDELAKPLDVAAIAALAATPEQAAEIWLASRLAVDPDDPREKAYLDDLAARLKLPDGLAAHLEAQASTVG
ncbi:MULTISPECIES: tellurite resistance TerB family protein [Inquilinus]|uniref:Uncharacterized membrane protein YebE (DUF533 family) n=1 Tax=Inquilinus ginsengisoli TaxID=363840 RepID=A0ABU1JZ37_9PROT|nr:tellurite resistance TerB family protein [Inquilinus ginsengisoli]MDR6293896.1 uncharacterized membrane protein YebE (DUF533 family) [Inquilinus ginsengisoli]